MTCLYLNFWPVSWSSPAAGAMRMYGVVSWVTIIAAKAKEDFQVSMHEGKKSQTEARPARRILVNSLLSELFINKKEKVKTKPTNKKKKPNSTSFFSSSVVSLVIVNKWVFVYDFPEEDSKHIIYIECVWGNGRLLGSAGCTTGLSKWKAIAYQITLVLTSLCNLYSFHILLSHFIIFFYISC